MSQHIVCVVGNPNCGKTTFFNALTGSRQRVGNWPGVTVDKKTGNFEYRNEKIELVDLPGIYSITPAASSGEDERVARDYILSGEAEAVINVLAAQYHRYARRHAWCCCVVKRRNDEGCAGPVSVKEGACMLLDLTHFLFREGKPVDRPSLKYKVEALV